MADLVLASGSPRRIELLRQINLSFEAISPNTVETLLEREFVTDYVIRMAVLKVGAIAGLIGNQRPDIADLPVLGADTVVALNDEILQKPRDREDAVKMLMKLSDGTHRVISAVAVKKKDQLEVEVSETLVSFRELTIGEAKNYWLTGEPADKAGAYGIQGQGAIFVASITGSYSNVVGLPLMETANLLQKFGVECLVSN